MMHNTGIKSGSAETATGALSVEGPQPVWMTLNEARERAFTGEVVFEVDPEVLAYFDNGVVYYAERVTDVSLGRRLLDAGVIESAQLERGTVRVGDVEHLGRLFDRDESVDRDAVLVMTETSTEDLIAQLANREIASVRVTAYRHHPSGVHRWFVAPIEGASTRPAGDVAQMSSSAIEDLSDVAFPMEAEELTIEWDEPFDVLDAPAVRSDGGELAGFDEFVMDLDLGADRSAEAVGAALSGEAELVLEPVEEDTFDDVVTIEPMVLELVDESDDEEEVADEVSDHDDAQDRAVEDFDFSVVWPDGSEVVADEEAVAEVAAEQPDPEVHFEMPPLVVDEPVSDDDDQVDDDVADAVRRAIAAIESATIEPASAAAVAAEAPSFVEVAPAPVAAPSEPAPAPAASPAFGGFAPPTMDMRAEVMYSRMEAEAEAEMAAEAAADDGAAAVTMAGVVDHAVIDAVEAADAGAVLPESGVASVVFVDDEADSGGNERSSALRRLIGSLRRKDR